MTRPPDPNPASDREKAEGDRDHVAPDAMEATERAVDEAHPRTPGEQEEPAEQDRPGDQEKRRKSK